MNNRIDELREKVEDIECSNTLREDDKRSDFDRDFDKVSKLISLEGNIVEIENSKKEADIKMAASEMEIEKLDKPWWKKIDPNTVITAGVGFVSTLICLNYEKINVITSKVFNKPRFK
ncbi:MAG: hypothetical protein HUJ63_09250 [Enterococcus sp.]|nr:hypothetical protein [Enterococcus sp.]